MNNIFINKSKKLLLAFLKEPGGFSFFPSSFFWWNNIWNKDLEKSYKNFFNSKYYDLKDSYNKVNLYIHIPFCTKICSYCNCFKKKLQEKEEIDKYLNYLEKEIILIYNLNNKKKININTIFIWWWTPNLLNIEQFDKLYAIIIKYFSLQDLEQFLIDWHPNYYSKEKLEFLKSIWVNRVTFAIQSFNNNVLLKNNRDIYNLNLLNNNIKFANKIWLKINIDLLIWLKWQNFEIVKNDFQILEKLDIDNISVHYLMQSNNIDYSLDNNFSNLIKKTKTYLKENKIPNFSSNYLENNYASKINTTLSIWASAITNIYSELICIKPNVNLYYNQLDRLEIPVKLWMKLSKRDEMVRFIYLNILYWINIDLFFVLFNENIFKYFNVEFRYLNSNWIIRINDWIIYSNNSDLDTLTYFNIFFIEKVRDLELNDYDEKELGNFFLDSWELIDK